MRASTLSRALHAAPYQTSPKNEVEGDTNTRSTKEIELDIESIAADFNPGYHKVIHNQLFDLLEYPIEGSAAYVKRLALMTEMQYTFPKSRVDVIRSHIPQHTLLDGETPHKEYVVTLSGPEEFIGDTLEPLAMRLICNGMNAFAYSLEDEAGKISLTIYEDEWDLVPSVVRLFFEMAN